MAEGVGFEPTESCPSHDFESCAFDRTQPPFHLVLGLPWLEEVLNLKTTSVLA
jgi:hypothetical protein